MPDQSYGYALSAVPWIIAVAGWLYAAHRADRRETRKELRAEISEISDVLAAITSDLKAHQSTEFGSGAAAASHSSIVVKLQRLISKTERLIDGTQIKAKAVEAQQCSDNLSAFFEVASNDKLERDIRLNDADLGLYLLDIQTAALILEESLYRLFRYKFPSE